MSAHLKEAKTVSESGGDCQVTFSPLLADIKSSDLSAAADFLTIVVLRLSVRG
jgi:hypothetical protein